MANADRTAYDPRETARLTKAIPKYNLGELLDERDMRRADLAEALGWERSRGNVVGEWISGRRRMSNADLIRVARELDVSPIFLLDLSLDEWPEDSYGRSVVKDTPTERRNNIIVDIHWLYATDEAIHNAIEERTTLDSFGESIIRKRWFWGMTVGFSVSSENDPSTVLSAKEIRQRIKRELLALEGDYRDLAQLAFDGMAYTLERCKDYETDVLTCRAFEAMRNLGYERLV